ncbi:hypothetical protein CEXT_379231 [Caerostris extrusa]|uniref:Uncharacterized protein n=1 Tax=Caerostris extrusa TaxID=172846 RepID=A0AAV4TWK7_CAEEX|nr:hypothetical protein CEXT_379231 [Caerostris extrusa]
MSIHFTPSDGEHSKRLDRKSSNFKCSIKTGKEHRKWPSEFDVFSSDSTPTRPTMMDNWGCNSRRQGYPDCQLRGLRGMCF